MVRAYLLLGSNMGDRNGYLIKARHLVNNRLGNLINASSVYETAPWGNTDQPAFLNQVLEIETTLLPRHLLTEVHTVELSLGRQRNVKWSSRTIDIDILFYGGLVIHEPELTIPHERIAERRFTLAPLAEMSPDLKHPVLKKTMQELLEECKDPLMVTKLGIPENHFDSSSQSSEPRLTSTPFQSPVQALKY